MIHIASESSLSSLTGIQEGDVQPNAVDLRLDKVFKMSGTFMINNETKAHRAKAAVPLKYGNYQLDPGSYEVTFENIVTMGEGEAGWVITRSTLNRNGLFLTSGLYDSGYSGAMAACLHVFGGPASIKQGTRIGQFLLFKSEALHLYDGSYGFNPDGTPKAEEARYH